MSRAKPRALENPVKSARKIISLSDDDFAKWLDRVVSAGLKTSR